MTDAEMWVINSEARQRLDVCDGCERIKNTLMSISWRSLLFSVSCCICSSCLGGSMTNLGFGQSPLPSLLLISFVWVKSLLSMWKVRLGSTKTTLTAIESARRSKFP